MIVHNKSQNYVGVKEEVCTYIVCMSPNKIEIVWDNSLFFCGILHQSFSVVNSKRHSEKPWIHLFYKEY